MKRISKLVLEQTLTAELGLKEPRFKLKKRGSWWNGSVISKTFHRKGDHQRQKMIWDALKRAFGDDADRLVGMLLAYTDDEWDIDEILVPTAKRKAG